MEPGDPVRRSHRGRRAVALPGRGVRSHPLPTLLRGAAPPPAQGGGAAGDPPFRRPQQLPLGEARRPRLRGRRGGLHSAGDAAGGSSPPRVPRRAGRPGESYESLRGPFNLEGKPLLADGEGAFGTPITDSQRVKVTGDTRQAWMVAYLPAGVVASEAAGKILEGLLAAAPVARVEDFGQSGGGTR